MAKELFDVCLTGNLLTGHNRREVAVNLAQLVGTSIPQAASLLEQASCVKSRVDESTAAYYHEIIEETGAEAVIRACLAHAESSQPGPVDTDKDDEPRFDAVPVVAPRPPQPAPAALAMIRPVAPVAVPTPPVPTPQPSLAPEQPIDIEPTPVLDEGMPPPALPDQDTTQPFATPLPAPLARRTPRWLKTGGAVVVLLLLGAAGFTWLLPAPVTPGLAIPLVGESLNLAQPFQQQVEQYWRAHGRPPASPQDLGWPGFRTLGELASLTVRANGVLVITYHDGMAVLAQQTLELQPVRGEQGFEWNCVGGTLSALERPLECRRTVVK